ncbi:hypothetical protein SGPA1_10235 [Streptomyces misionensis JCM 4497]
MSLPVHRPPGVAGTPVRSPAPWIRVSSDQGAARSTAVAPVVVRRACIPGMPSRRAFPGRRFVRRPPGATGELQGVSCGNATQGVSEAGRRVGGDLPPAVGPGHGDTGLRGVPDPGDELR